MSDTITNFRNGSALVSAGGHRGSGDRPYKDQANKRKLGQADTRTLSGYLDYWLENHAALRCQPKTLERYRQLAEYLTRLLGEVSMLELRPGLIQDAVNELQLRGGVATQAHPEGRPLAAKTVHSTASLLFTCLADATRLEHIPANPMARRKVNLPKRPKANPAVLDATALCTVFETAAGTRLYPLVVTAASSGCRRGELLALTWEDLDIEKGLMRVSKSVEQTRAGLRVKSTKSGRPRSIGLDDFTLDVLADHRERQRQDKAGHGSRYRDRDLIFCQPNGDFYSPDHVGTRTKALLRRSGYPECSLQSLRHSHASLLLGNGTPLAVVRSVSATQTRTPLSRCTRTAFPVIGGLPQASGSVFSRTRISMSVQGSHTRCVWRTSL